MHQVKLSNWANWTTLTKEGRIKGKLEYNNMFLIGYDYCIEIPKPANGGRKFDKNPVTGWRYLYGTKESFYCDKGYKRRGSSYATCIGNGGAGSFKFSGPNAPSCECKEIYKLFPLF